MLILTNPFFKPPQGTTFYKHVDNWGGSVSADVPVLYSPLLVHKQIFNISFLRGSLQSTEVLKIETIRYAVTSGLTAQLCC